MSESLKFTPGSKVRYRQDFGSPKAENAGKTGEVIEGGPQPDHALVFINWPSGRDVWERKDSLEVIADEQTYRFKRSIDEPKAKKP